MVKITKKNTDKKKVSKKKPAKKAPPKRKVAKKSISDAGSATALPTNLAPFDEAINSERYSN